MSVVRYHRLQQRQHKDYLELKMSDNVQNNKRIAKNTIILYVRMIVMMTISLYTTRVILEALGVDDYGIYNVVGGLVAMFSLISSSLSSSTSRFIIFGLGKGDKTELRKIFVASVNINIILAIIVILAIETIGVWFLNNRMTIPINRLDAANSVLHCSTITFAVGLLAVPYNASIIAHEKMSAFAYMTILDSVAKLAIALGIKYYGGDKLILFAVLNIIPIIISQIIYWQYCKRKFEECTYHRWWDGRIFKEIGGFALWNFIGCTAGTMKDQGVNIAINLFTGPAVNAARGIAMQINGIVSRFIQNFTIALNPQIIKDYAAGNLERMHKLIFTGTRFSYFLFMFLSIPIFFEVDSILKIWLGQVPEHTVLFTRLVLVLTLSEIISQTLITAQSATGKIRNYQIVVGGILLLNFPISYLLLYWRMMPEITLVVAIVISQICLVVRLYFLKNLVQLPILEFIKSVYIRVITVTIISSIIPFLCYYNLQPSAIRFVTVCCISIISSLISIYYIGCNKEERRKVINNINKVIRKTIRK